MHEDIINQIQLSQSTRASSWAGKGGETENEQRSDAGVSLEKQFCVPHSPSSGVNGLKNKQTKNPINLEFQI